MSEIPMVKKIPSQDKTKKIMIFEKHERHDIPEPYEDTRVFISIGAGETHVTILNAEGECDKRWTAVFGWSVFCDIGFESNGQSFQLDTEALISRALLGTVKIYGRIVDTTDFIDQASDRLELALEEILSRTVGSGAIHDAIVLAAPVWMHGILESSITIRPHILRNIREI
jgi:hypothetical protein